MADTILHNQPIGTPSDGERIAYGTPSTAAGNITLANFYNLLMTKLGFFKVSNLFSEIFGNPTSMAAARANLAAPSVTEMTTADNLRALKTNVIEKDSTVAFTPTIGTHPANKTYVDGGGLRLNWQTATTVMPLDSGQCRCCRVGIVTYLSIEFDYTSAPSVGDIAFTLPASFPLFIEDVYIALVGQSSNINVLIAKSGTRNIVIGAYFSSGKTFGSTSVVVY